MNDAVRATEEIRSWTYQTMGIPALAEMFGTDTVKGLSEEQIKQK